ncbi:MAG: hypothetical protein KAY65_13530 [Planctomycetes bacterium]|nr:hypothetical protein [Planctomycetota bacterium]
MKISRRYSPNSRNKSGSGGSTVFSGNSVLLGGAGRAKETGAGEANLSDSAGVLGPSALGEVRLDRTVPEMV